MEIAFGKGWWAIMGKYHKQSRGIIKGQGVPVGCFKVSESRPVDISAQGGSSGMWIGEVGESTGTKTIGVQFI